jgi:hypothetical protein
MKRIITAALTLASFAFVGAVAIARQATEPVDLAMIAKIKDEGLNRSQVGAVFDMFVNVIGPRLTGSPAHKRAADYARDTMTKWGLTNVHLEAWQFGRGWTLEKLTVEMVEPRYMPLVGYPEAWTPSTNGEMVVPALSTAGKSAEEIDQMPIAGAAIFQSPPVTNFIVTDRQQPALLPDDAQFQTGAPTTGGGNRQGGAAGQRGGATGAAATGAAAAGRATAAGGAAGGGRGTASTALAKAAVLIKPSRGNYGTVFVQAGRNNPPATTPAIVLMGEHYNMVARLLEHHVPVKLRVNVQSRFLETDPNSYNVIADIPGTDPALRDQLVLLGGHLDSWHTGTGATDNADGAAVVMEAFRILKAIGARPKRTIRVALWSGEEEGLLGSKAYVADHLAGDAHKAERDKFDVYFNIDPGRGPIYGWYLENNDAVKPIFDAWLAPFTDLGALKNVRPGIPSTDHLSFTAPGIGLPGFNPIQDYADYDTRLHHTNVDTFERVSEQDLKQNAIVLASFVYHSAMRVEMIPSAGRK